MSSFLQPGIANPEDKFTAAEHGGQLLLFFPTQFQPGIATAYGTADAVSARVVNLDTDKIMENALIFPSALVTQLKAAVPDGMVLGRLGQGENRKGNPPWLLSPHTDADVAKAEAWLTANPANKFAQPAVPPTQSASAAPATGTAPAWGGQGSAPAAPAADSAPAVDPTLAAILKAKGIDLPPGATQAAAEQIKALLG